MKKLLPILLALIAPLGAVTPLSQAIQDKVEFSTISSKERTPLAPEKTTRLLALFSDEKNFEWKTVKRCPFIARYALYSGDCVIWVSPSGNQLKLNDELFDYQPIHEELNALFNEVVK